MAKFNEVQKLRRAQIAERKRAIHGDPITGKLKNKPQPLSISGKRQRKLLKKWRRDQKEAMEKGLINMEDVEMAAAPQGEPEASGKTPRKVHLKKSVKIKLLRRRGKNKSKSSKPSNESSADAMVE